MNRMQSCARIAAVVLAAFIVFATLSPIGLRPTTGLPPPLERFAAFLVLGGATSLGWPRRRVAILVVVITAAVGLEAMQNLTPTRHGRVSDAMEKVLGACAGLLAAGLLDANQPRRFIGGGRRLGADSERGSPTQHRSGET